MNQLPQELVPAVCIITVKCLDNAPAATLPRIDPHCFPAAGTLLRYHALTIMPPVKVVLDMRDDHVPLRHQYAAPRMQFQIPDKGNVVEACPCYTATVNLHASNTATGAISPERPGVHSTDRKTVSCTSSSNL